MADTQVIIVQDGAIDELMSVILAWCMDGVETTGVGVLGADCVGPPTVEVTRKILAWLGTPDVPVTLSQARGVNAFPWAYRPYSMMANLVPILNPTGKPGGAIHTEPTAKMIVDLVHAAQREGKKAVLLVLCPLTPVADALKMDSEILSGIDKIVWMGGALEPANWDGVTPYGNIDTGIAPGANPNAEWNAYWDPFAVADVFASGLPVYMFPLNLTNEVMLTPDIVLSFAPESKRYPIWDLAGQLYSMVAFEAGYAFWDTVTTAYLGAPDLFTVEPKRLVIATEDTEPPTATSNQGTISEDPAGFPVQVATVVDVLRFYHYLREEWKKQPAGW